MIRMRVARLPVLALGAAIVGLLGACVLVWRWTDGPGPYTNPAEATVVIGAAAELLTVGLTVALFALVAWFHLYRRVALLQLLQAELQRLIDQSGGRDD